VAAVSVVVSHAFPLAEGVGTPEPLAFTGQVTLGHVGVVTFMAISGYLITASAKRSSPGRFVLARLLRVYPALVVVVVVTAAVTGSMSYLISATGVAISYEIPGVFETNPYPRAVNGSLWTLGYEIGFYALTLLAMAAGLLRRMATMGVWALALLLTAALPSQPWFFLGLAFMSGSLLYQLQPPLTLRLAVASAILLVGASIIGSLTVALSSVGAYLIVWLALRTPPVQLPVDVSYGTYLWAFPIQQTAALLGATTWWMNLAITLPVALWFGFLSWRYVESPALRLKRPRAAGTIDLAVSRP
jgi:peptidoglycan/LPS O-acetylase OafA/YrhL